MYNSDNTAPYYPSASSSGTPQQPRYNPSAYRAATPYVNSRSYNPYRSHNPPPIHPPHAHVYRHNRYHRHQPSHSPTHAPPPPATTNSQPAATTSPSPTAASSLTPRHHNHHNALPPLRSCTQGPAYPTLPPPSSAAAASLAGESHASPGLTGTTAGGPSGSGFRSAPTEPNSCEELLTVARQVRCHPVYDISRIGGKDHFPLFRAAVYFPSIPSLRAQGVGRSKLASRRAAATALLLNFDRSDPALTQALADMYNNNSSVMQDDKRELFNLDPYKQDSKVKDGNEFTGYGNGDNTNFKNDKNSKEPSYHMNTNGNHDHGMAPEVPRSSLPCSPHNQQPTQYNKSVPAPSVSTPHQSSCSPSPQHSNPSQPNRPGIQSMPQTPTNAPLTVQVPSQATVEALKPEVSVLESSTHLAPKVLFPGTCTPPETPFFFEDRNPDPSFAGGDLCMPNTTISIADPTNDLTTTNQRPTLSVTTIDRSTLVDPGNSIQSPHPSTLPLSPPVEEAHLQSHLKNQKTLIFEPSVQPLPRLHEQNTQVRKHPSDSTGPSSSPSSPQRPSPHNPSARSKDAAEGDVQRKTRECQPISALAMASQFAPQYSSPPLPLPENVNEQQQYREQHLKAVSEHRIASQPSMEPRVHDLRADDGLPLPQIARVGSPTGMDKPVSRDIMLLSGGAALAQAAMTAGANKKRMALPVVERPCDVPNDRALRLDAELREQDFYVVHSDNEGIVGEQSNDDQPGGRGIRHNYGRQHEEVQGEGGHGTVAVAWTEVEVDTGDEEYGAVTRPHKRTRTEKTTVGQELGVGLRLQIYADMNDKDALKAIMDLGASPIWVVIDVQLFTTDSTASTYQVLSDNVIAEVTLVELDSTDGTGITSGATGATSVGDAEGYAPTVEALIQARIAYAVGMQTQEMWVRRAKHVAQGHALATSPRIVVVHRHGMFAALREQGVVDVLRPSDDLSMYARRLVQRAEDEVGKRSQREMEGTIRGRVSERGIVGERMVLRYGGARYGGQYTTASASADGGVRRAAVDGESGGGEKGRGRSKYSSAPVREEGRF